MNRMKERQMLKKKEDEFNKERILSSKRIDELESEVKTLEVSLIIES